MDIWEIYYNSFDRELNSDEIDFLDTMIRKYPYFAVARFLKAKAIPTTYNISLASAHAPSRPLFKSFMEGEKSVRVIKKRPEMDKRDPNINTSHTQQKHQLFSMILSTPPKEERIVLPFSVLIPRGNQAFQGFLDTLIKEKVQKYRLLPEKIKNQIQERKNEKVVQASDPQADELIQRFLDKNPKIKRPPKGKGGTKSETFVDKSVNLDEEIVSETLAKLHLKQNNTAEALRIYRKLSLLFPEKSAYFDAQILEITHI